MEHRESKLKAELMSFIREGLPRVVAFRHEDLFTSGIPDISVTWRGKAIFPQIYMSWWEVKHGTPKFESTDIQELRLKQLAEEGFARYLIYMEGDSQGQRTLIVHPRNLKQMIPEYSCEGFNHRWVVRMIRDYHEGKK